MNDVSPDPASHAIDTIPVGGTASPSDWPGLVIVLLASAFQLWAVLQCQPLQSANDRSRWCTVWALVERGTYQIDEIDQNSRWSTIDKVRHRRDDTEPWHFYSSKPPLFATMVSALYWLERHTLGYDIVEHTAFVTRLLLTFINVLPMLLALLCFRKSLALLNVTPLATRILLITAGFASMLNPFLTTLNNHTPAAICLVFCLSAMIRIRAAREPAGADFAIVGAAAALTCCFELPAALFGVISFVFVLLYDWRKTAKFYVPAAIVPLAAFFVTNWICTGGIKPFYLFYGTEKYVFVHEGIPSYWSNPQGIDANSESPAVYLFHCVLGHHGILSLTPVFLLTLVGWWIGTRQNAFTLTKPVYWIGAGISAAIMGFYLTKTQHYNYGGNSAALRWMLWLAPFWWYGMVPAVERLSASAKGVGLMAVLLIPSIYSPMYSIQKPWRPGWVYQHMEQRGWIDYHTKIPAFSPPRFAVINALPDKAGVTNVFRGSGAAVGRNLVITTLPTITIDGSEFLPLKVELVGAANEETHSVTLVLPPNSLPSGRDPASIMKAVPGGIPASTATELRSRDLAVAPPWAVQMLRGLPSPRPYNSASPRYLSYTRAGGEKTALKCDRGAARVQYNDSQLGLCWQRCDVFYCDELPFGVAQWVITVTKDGTTEVVRTETWTCRNLP